MNSLLPPILQQLQGQSKMTPSMQPATNNSPLAQIKQMTNAMKAIGNPNELATMLLQNKNPALAQAFQYVKDNGGNAETACMKLLQENGIDLAEVKKLF